MALAFALQHIEAEGLAKVINYGQFLELFPPTHEVRIIDNSSWSCVHGVDRWRGDCGCCSGGNPGWNQAWRKPLREALDWLRDQLAPLFEKHAKGLLRDPWATRDAYIECVLNRDPAVRDAFIVKHAERPLQNEDRIVVIQLLESQRQAPQLANALGEDGGATIWKVVAGNAGDHHMVKVE